MNPWSGLRNLPKEMWLLALAVFVNRSGMMVLPFLVLYLTRTLGIGAKEAGLVLALYGIAALASAPFAGRLGDRIRPHVVMKYSLLLGGIMLLVLPLATDYITIVVVVVIWSIISEAFRPSALAFITDITAVEQRKAAFALNRLAINLGMSIGPALGGFLFVVSYHLLFWVDGITSILASGFLFLPVWQRIANRGHEGNNGSEQPTGIVAHRNRPFMYFLLANIPILIIFFQHEATLPIFFVRDLHLPESYFGFMFTINTVLIILLEVPINLATANRPHREMLTIGALLVGIGFGAMAFATNFLTIALTVVVWTFGEMIFLPSSATYVAELAPQDRRGEYMGLFQMSFSLGFALSALLGTAVLEFFGAKILWSLTFVAGCVSAAMLWRMRVPIK